MTFVKICCIASRDEAARAVAAGASAIGLVSAMPSGPGPIEDALIADIAAHAPFHVATFLLTAHDTAGAIVAQHRVCRTTTVQLVDHVPHAEVRALRERLPGIRLVQVIHVTGEESIGQAAAVAPLVDAVLLDSGNPSAPVKELGGTGRTHDWNISRRIRDAIGETPLILAGGLRADNVADAIRAVRPFGVDVCSGVRTNGMLDDERLRAFIGAVQA